jgi:hypothetical protein
VTALTGHDVADQRGREPLHVQLAQQGGGGLRRYGQEQASGSLQAQPAPGDSEVSRGASVWSAITLATVAGSRAVGLVSVAAGRGRRRDC